MPKAVVLYDLIRYDSGDKHPDGLPVFEDARRGDEVELSQDEFDRLSDPETNPPHGAVGKPGSKDTKAALEPAPDEASVDTE